MTETNVVDGYEISWDWLCSSIENKTDIKPYIPSYQSHSQAMRKGLMVCCVLRLDRYKWAVAISALRYMETAF